MLPFEIGRTRYGELNKLQNARDYMDIFLQKVETTVFKNSRKREYYKKFESWELFNQKHFLINSYIDESNEVIMYHSKKGIELVEDVVNKIKARAKYISESYIAFKLWEYFKSNNLIG